MAGQLYLTKASFLDFAGAPTTPGELVRNGTALQFYNGSASQQILVSAAANPFAFTTPTTPDALADVAWSSSATTQKALVLQAKAVQTANMFEVQTSAGVAKFAVGAAGSVITINGIAYTWPAADGSAGDQLTTNGAGTLSWSAAASSAKWNAIANPDGAASLTMAAYTTLFTFNDATGGGVNMFRLVDTAANSGTGFIFSAETAATSAASPFRAVARATAALAVSATGMTSITSPVGTGTLQPLLKVTEVAHTALTASTERNSVLLDLSVVEQQFATGALGTQRAVWIKAPTYAFVGASTITTAATLAIDNAPQAGTNATITNPYAIWVAAGNVLFAGLIKAGSGPTTLTDAAGKILSAALNTVGVAQGGTGQTSFTQFSLIYADTATSFANVGAATNGQIIIGSTGAAPALATISATSNQTTVTNGAGTITFGTVQDINTVSTPSFAGVSALTANGAKANVKTISEEVTLNTGGVTTDSTGNLLPANSFILGVCYRVTVEATDGVSLSIGEAGILDEFGSGIAIAAATVSSSYKKATPLNPSMNSAAAKVRITAGSTPSQGKVRVTVFYIDMTEPTS